MSLNDIQIELRDSIVSIQELVGWMIRKKGSHSVWVKLIN